MTTAEPGRLIAAGDIEMYVEVEGAGPDIVLLHGGGGRAGDLAGLRAHLRAGHRLIVPEQRAHGRTADVGELTYAQMAVDTAALLDAMEVRDADLVGWSDGGIVAMMLARDRPDLVRHVVAIGANVNADGAPNPISDENTAWLENATPADLDFEMSVDAKARLLTMWKAGPEITVDDLRRITRPVLLISGDRDVVTLEHTVAMYHALPDARLSVIAGADHFVPLSSPDAVAGIAARFLAGMPADGKGA
ncbi:MAG TPA: alpha/beta hydrolase [Methylomirabilota bacterium]|nr:alpha/beta hydrolase [Methylomirabilota bacterium]